MADRIAQGPIPVDEAFASAQSRCGNGLRFPTVDSPFAGAAYELENAPPGVRARVSKREILHLTVARYQSQLQFVIFARQPIESVTIAGAASGTRAASGESDVLLTIFRSECTTLNTQKQRRRRLERFLRAFLAAPVETVLFIPEHISVRHEYRPSHKPELDWEGRLHGWLGAPWPCPARTNFDVLWRDIASELQAQGLRFGRQTYGEYSDSEQALARAAWCTVLHQRPSVVVETGVARGVTSRIVLEALDRNRRGHLWSIDLPHLFEKNLHAQTGAAVPDSFRRRWTYILGSSRRRLPSLLRTLGQVDLFIHDSLHTARNTRFEMEQTLRVLAPGGVMIVDDISTHQAFFNFAEEFPTLETLVCPHSDRVGSCFGLVHKPAIAAD